jgi:hypothetical protein
MRRLTACLIVALALAAGACKRAAKPMQFGVDLSVIQMDDARGAAQLVSGFYPPEGNPWRWTAGKFSADLKPPAGAGVDGARLELKLNIPEVVIQKLGPITLSASAGGAGLAPEKFTAAGNYVYAADVPAEVLRGPGVNVEFSTDKSIPAGSLEKRELAVIVSSLGLISK